MYFIIKPFIRRLSTIAKSYEYHRLFQDLQITKRINKSRFELVDKSIYFREDLLLSKMKPIDSKKNLLGQSYLLESNNPNEPIIDTIKSLSNNKPFEMSSTMFIQLYLQLEKNPSINNFVFHYHHMIPNLYSISNYYIDNNTKRFWTIYPSTFQMYNELYNQLCPTYYADILQIDQNKFIGLTENGYKIGSLSDWIDYIYTSTIDFVNRKILSLELEQQNFTEKIKNLESDGKFLSYIKTKEFDFYIRQGGTLQNLSQLKTYIDLGFLDLMTIKEKDEYCINIGINNSKKLIKKVNK